MTEEKSRFRSESMRQEGQLIGPVYLHLLQQALYESCAIFSKKVTLT